MAFSGPSLDRLVSFIQRTPQVRAPISMALAQTALTAVQQEFRGEVNPFGDPWTPLAKSTVRSRRHGKKGGADKILSDTARLKNSFTAPSDENGFKLGTNVGYAVYHQQPDGPGKGIIPRRQLVPDAGTIPADWSSKFHRVASKVMRDWRASA